MRVFLIALAVLAFGASGGRADPSVPEREGWSVRETAHGFDALVDRLGAAVKAEGMLRVYLASASRAAKGRGVEIPGNAVMGVYRNDYAVRMLAASVAAGMEAPIEFYVTENADGGATLSYKKPSFVFAPYAAEGGPALAALAEELDAKFDAIAARAAASD